MREYDRLNAADRKRFGQLGGALMIIGSLAAVPAALFLEPAPEPVDYLGALAGVVLGAILLILPWEELPDRALYAVPVIATAYVTIGAVLFSDDFGFYQVLIGVYTAYAVKPRVAFLALMALFTLATLAPLLFVDETFSEQAHHILVILPVLFISAAVVRYLRGALTKREREYRHFALEAVGLAERIRGGGPTAGSDEHEDVDRRLEEIASRTRRGP
ncbi:MAG TPA: hypothetical protein VD766_12570 [Solirubrobacterales bacterium]|nr:hypothetical protein [Solirubrobacterales bacterium]